MRFVAVSLIFVAPAFAAPPTLTSLSPSGGQQATTSTITVSGTFDPWPVQASASTKGIAITPTKEKGKLSITIAADVVPGTHWLRLYNNEGASEQRPFIVGTLPEINEVEPNDDPKKPQLLTGNCVVNGKLGAAGDVDHFGMELKKGQTLVASLQANSILRSPMDSLLQVVSTDGFVLAESHDVHGLDPEIVFAVPTDGRYVIRVFAFPSMPDSSIRFFGSDLCVYRLTATTAGFASHAFPLAIAQKDPTLVELRGWDIPEAAKKLPVKAEKIGEQITVWHPSVAQSASIRVEPHRCIAEIEPNDLAHPQEVESPVTISGCLSAPRDSDAFRVKLKKSERRIIRLEAAMLGSSLDPILRILDSSGKTLNEIRTANTPTDPEINFTAPADGDYRIEVRDLYNHGGERYFYRLRIALPAPDFSLSLAADQFTLTGEMLEIPVTVNRLNGYTQPIDVRAVDLPDGVKCDPVTADAAAKMVKLKVTATKTTSGAIRIQGGDRTAKAPLATFGTTTEAIWLTIRSAKK